MSDEQTTDAEQMEVPGADTTPAPDAAPKRSRRRASSSTRPTTRAGRRAASESADRKAPRQPRKPVTRTQVKASIVTVHQLGAMGATLLGKPNTGAQLEQTAAPAAEVWADVAARYPAIERILVGGGDAALFGSLLAVYVPIVMTALTERRDPAAAAGVLGLLGAFGPMGAGPVADEQPAA